MDRLTAQQRHDNMSRIHSQNTAPEKLIRTRLHKAGYRYRICDKRYPGKPDIVLPHYHAVIFINGCFWHGHENCPHFRFPKTRQSFWIPKITKNKERDAKNLARLQTDCWRICIVWECSLKGKNARKKIDAVTEQIVLWLDESFDPFLEIRGPTKLP